MLNIKINYVCDNPLDFFKTLKNQMYSNERSQTKIDLENNKIIFTIIAKDESAARASFNAICQNIKINEKMNKIFENDNTR